MLTVLSSELEATATYAERSLAWVSDGSGEVVNEDTGEVLPGLGKLTVKVQKARRPGSACDIDSYCVQEADPSPEGWRTFLLLNLTDRTQPQPYRVTLSPVPTCTCKAGQCKTASDKHVDSIVRLVELDVLGDPAPAAEPEPPPAYADWPDEPEWARGAASSDTSWLTEG